MDAFIGNIDAKIDSKGRAFVPATFRKVLQAAGETSLVLRKDTYKDCLVLYSEKVWREELSDLRARLNKWDEDEQHLFRQFSYSIASLELDSNGRILIPKKYLLMANILNDVCFVGVDSTIELWSPELLAKSILSYEDMKSQVKKLLGSKPAVEKVSEH